MKKKWIRGLTAVLMTSLIVACGNSPATQQEASDVETENKTKEAVALSIVATIFPEYDWVCVILSVTVVGIFVLFYHRIFAITFDEEFVRAKGVRVAQYNLLIAVVIAVIIVLAMNLVGSLLISDAAACCSQGLEFTLEDGEYPPDGAEITVTGLFDTYAEDVYEYSYLKDARLSVE